MNKVANDMMANRQRSLFKRLDKDFYTAKELMDTVGMSYEEIKRIRHDDKGFSKLDIIIALMGGVLYQTI